MRNFKVDGIIIKRRNFGEADRILTVFTQKNGKIQVKALGVRRLNSRRSSHIELLNHSSLTLYKAQTLPILTEAQTLDDFCKIKENLAKVGFAYHICELIDGLCAENQENPAIFALLLSALKRVSQEEDIVDAIHNFEISLLTNLGFYPHSRFSQNLNTQFLIEQILERKLKSKQLLSHFAQ